MSVKKIVAIAVIIVALLAIIFAIFMLRPANISREEARETAITYVGGGTANRASRDLSRFQRAWSVEVFYNGFVHEVYVSMRTGEVLRVEIDRWD